jgi:hypothetical protein
MSSEMVRGPQAENSICLTHHVVQHACGNVNRLANLTIPAQYCVITAGGTFVAFRLLFSKKSCVFSCACCQGYEQMDWQSALSLITALLTRYFNPVLVARV